MGPARGQPGPALPRRGGTATEAAVRHRTGRPAGRVRAGRAGRADRTATRPEPGEAPLRGRLVDPPVAARLVDLRRAGRRAAPRAAWPARRGGVPAGDSWIGAARGGAP